MFSSVHLYKKPCYHETIPNSYRISFKFDVIFIVVPFFHTDYQIYGEVSSSRLIRQDEIIHLCIRQYTTKTSCNSQQLRSRNVSFKKSH